VFSWFSIAVSSTGHGMAFPLVGEISTARRFREVAQKPVARYAGGWSRKWNAAATQAKNATAPE